VPVTAGPTTVDSGQTPIVIWWDYLLASEIGSEVKGFKIVIPTDAHADPDPDRSFLNGNVLAGQENIGKALGLGLVVISTIAMIIYTLAQRRASRWLRRRGRPGRPADQRGGGHRPRRRGPGHPGRPPRPPSGTQRRHPRHRTPRPGPSMITNSVIMRLVLIDANTADLAARRRPGPAPRTASVKICCTPVYSKSSPTQPRMGTSALTSHTSHPRPHRPRPQIGIPHPHGGRDLHAA
jgi:hypothetical protein